MTAMTSRQTRWFAVGSLAIAGIAFVFIAGTGINKKLVYLWPPRDLHHPRAHGARAAFTGRSHVFRIYLTFLWLKTSPHRCDPRLPCFASIRA